MHNNIKLNCHEAINESVQKCTHGDNGESCVECNLMIDLSLSSLGFRRTHGRGVFSPQVNDWLDQVDKAVYLRINPPTPKFEEFPPTDDLNIF